MCQNKKKKHEYIKKILKSPEFYTISLTGENYFQHSCYLPNSSSRRIKKRHENLDQNENMNRKYRFCRVSLSNKVFFNVDEVLNIVYFFVLRQVDEFIQLALKMKHFKCSLFLLMWYKLLSNPYPQG